MMPEELPGDDHFNEPPAFFPREEDEERIPADLGVPVEVTVEGVYAVEQNGHIQHYVLLTDGARRLPISIGPVEAHSISCALANERYDRPLTHDLLKAVIDRLDGSVVRAVIDDLWNSTYYAKIFLRQGGEEMAIDARPSDAVAIAIRYEAPIFASDGILDAVDG